MDHAETIAALFEQKSPGVFVYRRKIGLLASRAAEVPVILIGVVGASVALLLNRTAWEGALHGSMILLIVGAFLRRIELEINCAARILTRRWLLPGAGTVLSSRRRVADHDYAQYFLPQSGGIPGRFRHELKIVRGRKRYAVLTEVTKNRDVIPNLDETGQAVAGLLGIEYRGVETDAGFFWW
jgi:hypothetical protein